MRVPCSHSPLRRLAGPPSTIIDSMEELAKLTSVRITRSESRAPEPALFGGAPERNIIIHVQVHGAQTLRPEPKS